jgi:hypothetical protein
MRTGVAGMLRGPIIVRGELYQQAAAGLLDAVRHGGTAFEHVCGERFFEHLDRHAGHEAAFQGSMAGRGGERGRGRRSRTAWQDPDAWTLVQIISAF